LKKKQTSLKFQIQYQKKNKTKTKIEKMMIFDIKNLFIVPVLSIIGFILNSLSTIVFSLIVKNGQRDDMYKHLLLKSICETLGCFFSAFGPMYYCNNALHSYFMIAWYIWFHEYIIKALFMASTGFEIAATFNCAISIEKHMKWCEKKLSFWLWVGFILIVSFGGEMFWVFTFSIHEYSYTDEFNKTVHRYYLLNNPFLVFERLKFGLAESIIKEVLVLLILLSLNIYILFKLIQIGRRKKRLTSNSSNVQNSNRAENRKIIMIIVLFLTFLLGHLPNVLWYTVHDYFDSNLKWNDLSSYGEIFLYLSYSTYIFVYFAFNNIFRSFFIKTIHFRSFF
jgi:hypothetical protein